MQVRRALSFPFRSYIKKWTQQFSTDSVGWRITLLLVVIYYIVFCSLLKPGAMMRTMMFIGPLACVLNSLGAWFKTRRGAVIITLILLPSNFINQYFISGTLWNQWQGLLPMVFIPFGTSLVIAHFRSISNRLSHAYKQLSEAHNNLTQIHEIMQRQALTDSLTNLPNHRAVMDQLQKELERARRYGRPLSVLFFDADRFKQVNDTHGHVAGDTVLRQIGERAASALRGGDTLGRFGGEEFVILLPEADANEASAVAERIRVAVAAGAMAVAEVEGGIAMTVSIGLACYPTDGTLEQALLSQADEAMYVAKRLGRNQVRTAEETRHMSADIELMTLLQLQGQREAAEREGITPEHLRQTYTLRTIYSLMALLERRDEGLRAHAYNVSDLATAIAQMMGLEHNEVTRIGMAALLHDIGKIAIPDQLLQKVGPLSVRERALLEEHAELGAQILEASPFLLDLRPAVRHHHERWDGCGYPDQLSGDAIPLAARIIAVAGAYDTMLKDHTYQFARTEEEARAELRSCAGGQFDPQVLQALWEVLADQEDQASPLKLVG